MPLVAIYNPECGNKTAKSVFEEHVLPLLEKHGKKVDKLVATESAQHAGQVLLEFLNGALTDLTVVLGSGDGTLHDIINFLSSAQIKGVDPHNPLSRIHFVLVPCGTANALYSSLFPPSAEDQGIAYQLQSVHSYIEAKPATPLSLAISSLSSPPSTRKTPQVAISAVVASTSLHALILRDSESLRSEIPGIERFKVAAQKNSAKWYNSYVKLFPSTTTGVVQIYDPATGSFVDHPESRPDDPIVDVDGPFVYFLSTVNVDRLEPQFKITPLARTIAPSEASCDLVMLRPLRDPATEWDSPEAREEFVSKVWTILGDVYKDGAHINLRYNDAGEVVEGGDGPAVVEYVRCGGWEWIPLDEDAHTFCADGTIFSIEEGGRAVCSAVTPNKSSGFAVHS